MPLLLVTSVGISLFANWLPNTERTLLFEMANKPEGALTHSEIALLDRAEALARQAMTQKQGPSRKLLSAEINGILSLMELGASPNGAPIDRIHHILIATDTAAGRRAARCVEAFLAELREPVEEAWQPTGLQTANLASFRSSAAKLAADMLPVLRGYSDNKYEIVFNLTGGFKGANAFLQTMSLISGGSSIYIFEGSRELMIVPALPVRLASNDLIASHEFLFRRLGYSRTVSERETRHAGLPEALLFSVDGQVILSEYGMLAWKEAWLDMASKQLLEPSHSKIQFSNGFRSQAKRLPANRLAELNDALDCFASSLDGKPNALLKSNTFKMLKGNPVPPSTHELYAWSDGGAGRIFMHEADGGWMIDAVDAHL